jgi:hypothetical protein
MNLPTAVKYASHGYYITRDAWKNNGVVKSKLHEHNGLLCDDSEYILLAIED